MTTVDWSTDTPLKGKRVTQLMGDSRFPDGHGEASGVIIGYSEAIGHYVVEYDTPAWLDGERGFVHPEFVEGLA